MATDLLVPFALPTTAGSGGIQGVSSVSTWDFNNDGHLDILTGAYGAGRAVWYQGDGSGNFGQERIIDGNIGDHWFMAADDLDGDGDIDVVAGPYTQTFAWYENDGVGNFLKHVLSTDTQGPVVAIADVDGDTRKDLFVSRDGGTTLYMFRGLASGGFAAREVVSSDFTGLGSIFFEDLDEDGDLDLLTGDYHANKLSWHMNNGNGTFTVPTFVTGQDFAGLAKVVDLTGDGLVDLVSLEYGTASITMYPQLSDSSGFAGFGSRQILPITLESYAVEAADMDMDGDVDILSGAYGNSAMIAWIANDGTGVFSSQLEISTSEGQVSSLKASDIDGDDDLDLIVGSFSEGRASIYKNKLGEFSTQIVPPAPGTYLLANQIEVGVHFGYPVVVDGVPSISLDIGGNTVTAQYVSGTSTPTIKFRYQVQSSDVDLDGVQLASSTISLNGSTIVDPFNEAVDTSLPLQSFTGVLVNGDAPFVQSISRINNQVTAAESVQFLVAFNEDVLNVDADDFQLSLNGSLTGQSIVEVQGNGSTRTVTVNTGTGSGTIGLHVQSTASITDLLNQPLGSGYAGGELYTLRSQNMVPENRYTAGHGDFGPHFIGGHLELKVSPDGFEYTNEDVEIYGNSDGLITRPTNTPSYDFIGVNEGEDFYLWTDNGNVLTVPELGISGEGIAGGTFASRFIDDPRVNATGNYFKLQMMDVRSTNDGVVSVYTVGLTGPTVWMASHQGLDSTDAVWLQQGSHQHFNFAFSKPGKYEVDFVTSGYRDINGNGSYDEGIDAYIESGVETIFFGIDYPIAKDDTFQVSGSNSIVGNLVLDDEAENAAELIATLESQPGKGTVALQPNGAFTYTPSPAFDGTDSFTYRLTNPRGGFTTATVTLQAAAAASPIAGLVTGHADIGIAFEAGELEPHVHAHLEEEEEEEGGEEHEDHGGLEYAPSEILIQVQTEGAITVPADPQFAFLGTPGQTVYALPTSPDPALPFLGFGTEEILTGTFDGDIRLELVSVSGPGNFSIWNFDTLGNLELLMATSDGVSEDDVVPLNEAAHVHRNIAFSAPGNYEVTFRAIAELDGESIESEEVTYLFAVATGRAPELALSAGERLYTEQSAPVQIDAAAMITDTDSSNFDGGFLRVDIPIGAHTEDVLSIRSQGTAINQISILGSDVRIGAVGGPVTIGTWSGGTSGEPLVVNLNSNATVTRLQLVLRSILFANMSDDPTGEHRLVRFVVADGDGEISNATIREVLVTPVNDAPVVTTSSGASSYIENATPSIVDGAITVSDIDSPDFDLGRLVVAITSNIQTQDRLSILAQGDGPGEINLYGNSVLYEGVVIGTYVGGFTTSTALTVNLNASATPDATQALARRIAYHNAGDNPGYLTRTIRFQVTDGDGMLSLLAHKSMEVSSFNDAPAIRLSTTNQTFIEQGIPKAIDTAAVVGDSDSVNFDGGTLTVDLSSGAQSDDALSILNVGLLNNQISVSGNEVRIGTTTGPVAIGTFSGGSSGTPLVISLNANATPSRVSTLARNIAFRNPSESPTNILRTARFVVTDGDGGTSLDATRNIAVTPVNDAPVIVTSSGNTIYTENDGATVIDAAVTIADVDSLDFNTGKLTITIGVNVQTQDRLTILAQGNGPGEINLSGTSVLYEGVVIGSYVGGFTSSAALTINLNASATPEATQALARRIAFHNAGDSPTSLVRTIRFQVSDGDGMSSLVPSKLVEVIATNDAPTIANLGGVVAYVQNNPAILIGPAAVVNDVDSNDFAGGSLTASFAAGGIAADRLAIRNQGAGAGRINTSGSDVTYQVGSVVMVIGTWTGGVGTTPLVIQFNSNATKVAVQALVRNLTFQVIGSTPTSSRTIRLSLTDGHGGTSVDADKVVNVIGISV